MRKNASRKKKHLAGKIAGAVFLFLIVLAAVPLTRSILFMSVYSRICASGSVIQDVGLDIQIPSGEGWYPFVMTFQDDEGFSRYTGENCRLAIMYNFPSFTSPVGHTLGYEADSPYYSSFYGCYVVQQEEEAYGWNDDGSLNAEDVADIARFDFFLLVLSDFGLQKEDRVFEWTTTSIEEHVSYAGSDDWICADAELSVNGMAHTYEHFTASYVQYGTPGTAEQDFEVVTLYGRIYGKYYEEENVSVFFYIITADTALLEETDMEILSQSTLRVSS